MTDVVPWVKWRFDRWRSDEGLRMCGLAARGLWADLLAIMHGCTPYGHLAINGRAPTPKQIASMVGMTSEDEVAELLVELEENGVFSRSETGLIFNRRMVRDNAARDLGKATGQSGGNPILTGKKPAPPAKKQPVRRAPSEGDNAQKTALAEGGLTPPVNPEKRRGEERREESVLRTAPEPAPGSDKTSLWREGLQTLQRVTGQDEGPSRKLLGKLLDGIGGDHARLLALIRRAETEQPDEPVPWLMAGAGVKPSNGHSPKLASPLTAGTPRDQVPTSENRWNGWEDGREVVGGHYWESLCRSVLGAAGMNPARWSGDCEALRRWLHDDIGEDTILTGIRTCVAWDDYNPPRSLAYFDKPVRQAHGTASP